VYVRTHILPLTKAHMTQQQYKSIIEKELRKLNEEIDLKIVKGQKFTSESQRHLALLKQAKLLERQERFNWIYKLFSFN